MLWDRLPDAALRRARPGRLSWPDFRGSSGFSGGRGPIIPLDFWHSAASDVFARHTRRQDGKDHRYFSIVENRRLPGDKTVPRTVLYLGEINGRRQAAWRKTLDVFDEDRQCHATMSLFPDDREIPAGVLDSVPVKLSGLELPRPRIFGNCWLACPLWHRLGLHEFRRQRQGCGFGPAGKPFR
jgi:hypothetical protein